jgi:Xaa-Pro aminopeptidase
LKTAGVTLKPYEGIVPDVEAHVRAGKHAKVWLDKSRANYALSRVIPNKQCVDSQNAITPLKACKNEAEMEGMRKAHIVDGAAMAYFMGWLEDAIVNQGRSVSEVEIDEVLTGYRAKQEGFVECSFPTIAGVGANAAIIHYRAKPDTELMKHLDQSSPILIDSGGQYTYGTTDVTRTWSFQQQPDPEFIDYYTRVLKGNIGLDVMVFPENTPGFVLDVYARRWLWDIGADYGHGTGHGVGAALNVHEGPQSISPRWANKEVLKKGMVVSNEPGYYEDGNFGVRIENLLEIQYVNPEDNVEKPVDEKEDAPKNAKKKFLKFAKLTMIPIQKNLINVDLMTDDELDWLDDYHADVFEKVSPLLEADSPAMAWLKKSCEKIDRTRTK